MKKQCCKNTLTFLFSFMLLFSSCDDNVNFDNNVEGNFDALWTIMDENYCFFDYKNIDWDDIYVKYRARVRPEMNRDALFKLMGEMLSELKDGHVNLYASHDMTRYWNWSEDYPDNFNSSIVSEYLGDDYMIAGGMRYKIFEDNVGYVYYSSFSNSVGNGNLSEIISRMAICNGMIIDIRDNGGGNLTNVDRISSRFFNEKTLVGYIVHKTGKGHNDFSKLYPKYVESYNGLRYQKPVIVLTNRSCYSAANDFTNVMKHAPNCTIVGDTTGGGSGLPFSSELPNGWSVRFSASPFYNVDKEHTEFGIAPDVCVSLTDADVAKNVDTLIEAARSIIKASK